MKFSLIMCTVGRTNTLYSAISSIINQTYKSFELIIVDQNSNDVLKPILEKFSGYYNIKHIRSNIKGLSANRNIGIKYAQGEIIAFPDDDCLYLPNTLDSIKQIFDKNSGLDVVTINIKGINSEMFFINDHSNFRLNRYNFKPYAISIGIFVRYKSINDVWFDEELGAGKYFGAAEESDMVSELLENKYCGMYFGNNYVLHPIGVQDLTEDKKINRYQSYNLGFGAFMKKEIVKRRKHRLLFSFSKELMARFIGGIIPNKKRHLLWTSFTHQLKGFLEYKIQ